MKLIWAILKLLVVIVMWVARKLRRILKTILMEIENN